MHCLSVPLVRAGRLTAAATAIVFASAAQAAFVPPNDWVRGEPRSTYQAWNQFNSATEPNQPDVANQNSAGTATLRETTGTAFLTSGKNLYSPTTVLGFEGTAPNLGLGDGYVTRVWMQTRTLGAELDYPQARYAGLVPTSTELLERSDAGGPFGGQQVDYLLRWDLPRNAALDTFSFAASGTSSSLDQVSIDTYAIRLGDMNNDGEVDNDDIAGFVTALLDLADYQTTTGLFDGALRGDLKRDSILDNDDIAPFVAALIGGDPAAVPEPGALGLATSAMLCGTWLTCRQSSRRRGATPARGLTLVELLVAAAILGTLVAMLLPAVQQARATARRSTCANHLKQLGLAMHLYSDAQQTLPPARLSKATTASAFVAVLPFIEQLALATQYDYSLAPSEGSNAKLIARPLAIQLCPAMVLPFEFPRSGCGDIGAASSYGLSTGNLSTRYGPHTGAIVDPHYGATTIAGISRTDGSSHTLLLGELDYGLSNFPDFCQPGQFQGGSTQWAMAYPGVSWASTVGVFNSDRLVTGFLEWETFRGDHVGGANFAMVDGGVRFVGGLVDAAVLDASATRDGGECVDLPL